MSLENSHPLVKVLADQFKKVKQAIPDAVHALQEKIQQIGSEKISQIDVSNLSGIVDIGNIAKVFQQALSEPLAAESADEQVHIFARTSPVKSTQVAGGNNQFLPGTHSNTIGPIIINQLPPIWIDFIRTQRSVALYIQGNPVPIMYFKVSVRFRSGMALPVPKQTSYKIVPTSVWIQAKVLHGFTPAELYTGLKISSGNLQITGDFTTNQNGIILNSGANFTCDLQLLQKALPAFLSVGQYGKDANDATIQLPNEFSFSSNGALKVGGVQATLFNNAFSAPENDQPNKKFFLQQKRLGLSLNIIEEPSLSINDTQSPLVDIYGVAPINNLWWALPLAEIQLGQPLEADGNGALLLECGDGLSANIKGTGKDVVYLKAPQFLLEPGRINMTDMASNGQGKLHEFAMWKDNGKYETATSTWFLKDVPFVFNTLSQGDELLNSFVGFSIDADRPVNIKGEAVPLRSEKGTLTVAANETATSLTLEEYELLIDKKSGPNTQLPTPQKMALALSNALLTTTLPATVSLQANVSNDFKSLTDGLLEISFGLYAYLPTLPDPYAANLGIIRRQFGGRIVDAKLLLNNRVTGSEVWMWVIAKVNWSMNDNLPNTSFELVDYNSSKILNNYRLPFIAPNQQEVDTKKLLFTPPVTTPSNGNAGQNFIRQFISSGISNPRLAAINRQDDVNPVFSDFALLDVSSNANQMGVAFSHKLPYMQRLASNDANAVANNTDFPLKVEGMSVITAGKNAQAFTMPGIAWEPLLNMSDTGPADPLPGFNYFPNDGVPTVMGNLSNDPVVLAPIPLSKHLVDTFKSKRDGKTYALFNLPFGMIAFAILNQDNATQKIKPSINNVLPEFEDAIIGGIQLELLAGSSFDNDNGQGLFEGYTFQLANLYDQLGGQAKSTLSKTPTDIFNQEFLTGGYTPKVGPEIDLKNRPGVPVTGIGLSGYGTSMASKWANDDALFAQVSKAEFNVYTGRTSHELVQVVSKEYPFGAKMVRTITIFRMSNGYVARVDSGWKAQTPGVYDFSFINDNTNKKEPNAFNFHPGIVKGIFNIRNIKEVPKDPFDNGSCKLQAITYDADVLLENVAEGGNAVPTSTTAKIVPSTGVLGYIQISPPGLPISADNFVDLLKYEGGSIGGSINCVVKIAGTDQHMKLNRFEVAPSVDTNGDAIFVACPRGSAFLPKDGSWSLVQHKIGNGNVTPLAAQFSVPLIKEGLRPGFDASGKDLYIPVNDIAPDTLYRIADPANLLVTDTTASNYGFLQNMGSQKVLFLTPSFKKGTAKLLSKTPPLLADSFRLLNGSAIFPNIGDANTNFGEAVSLLKAAADGAASAEAFLKTGIKDLGKDVYEILDINLQKEGDKFLEQGYELAKKTVGGAIDKALKFDLPNGDYNLVNLPDKLVIAIRYKTSSKPKDAAKKDYPGKFDFDVNSLAADAAENWKGKLNNLAIVVSVGPMKELMTVKGNFNSQKGKDLDLGSNDDAPGFALPTPEIEFSKEVEPVIRILEILAALSTGDYGAALKKGLKVAMSNSGDIWEYKMEASKEIPLVRFPPGPAYESPQTPLKLECSLQVGFNVNAALKVTSDPKQLLPTAGAFFAFRGRLMVMCVSVGGGSVFAIGEAGIRLEADTSPKIGVLLHFGFGAQIGVGLPVVGTATVTFMVGVEVEATSAGKIAITAFMSFKGQAELLAGLVSICILIEARGTVEKSGPDQPANCEVQVSFAIDVSIFLVINIHFSESWSESRQIA